MKEKIEEILKNHGEGVFNEPLVRELLILLESEKKEAFDKGYAEAVSFYAPKVESDDCLPYLKGDERGKQ